MGTKELIPVLENILNKCDEYPSILNLEESGALSLIYTRPEQDEFVHIKIVRTNGKAEYVVGGNYFTGSRYAEGKTPREIARVLDTLDIVMNPKILSSRFRSAIKKPLKGYLLRQGLKDLEKKFLV